VPARVIRLTAGSGRNWWLRPDWFADGRVEPVMAHPRFNYPMYEPLHRYDRDWMVPGAGLIERPDMATLLQTNNRFIEAYLTGLNHEMARELLWCEFPTDQRGTYFSSFWTGGRNSSRTCTNSLAERHWGASTLPTVVSSSWCAVTWSGAIPASSRAALSRAPISGHPDLAAGCLSDAVRGLPPNILLVGFAMTHSASTVGEVVVHAL
jgi:hypothetical protein